MSFPSTESYSLRTSITPSSSKVRWCGVVVELHWLGNLAFFLLPPVSTASKTSLASTVVSGIFSHQKNQKKLLLERRNTAKHRRGGWDAAKNFFSSFSTRSQKYELFAFWQQQQSRLSPCDWSTREQWNKVEWHIIHMRGLWLDKKTTCSTWLVPWMAFPAKKLVEKGANKPAQHHGKSIGSKKGEIYADLKFYLKPQGNLPPHQCFY